MQVAEPRERSPLLQSSHIVTHELHKGDIQVVLS